LVGENIIYGGLPVFLWQQFKIYIMDKEMIIAILVCLIIFLILVMIILRFLAKRANGNFIKLLEAEILEKDKTIYSLENQKEKFTEERTELIREMHDRVINNLQIVVSLLNTQSYYLKNGAALKAIRISQQRMYAISLIHHVLNQSEDYSRFNIRNYTYELVESLKDRMDTSGRIHFDIQVENILLDLTKGAPLGLILHEAIVNAITHGFPGESTGVVAISLTNLSEDNQLKLIIADNGQSFPSGQEIDKTGSLGIRLMEGLCGQLGGQFTIVSQGGVRIQMIFSSSGDQKTG
jgi:two-component sensor histidine kinase